MNLISLTSVSKLVPANLPVDLISPKARFTNAVAHGLLRVMAVMYNHRPHLNRYLKTQDGWLNFAIGFQTEDQRVAQSIHFHDGRVKVRKGIGTDVSATMIFKTEAMVWDLLRLPPNELLVHLMRGKLRIRGNMNYMSLFNFLLSLLLAEKQRKKLQAAKLRDRENLTHESFTLNPEERSAYQRPVAHLKAEPADNAIFLDDPYLGDRSLADFPRLKTMLGLHFNEQPAVCIERPLFVTRWHRENGMVRKKDGSLWNPVLRQGTLLGEMLAAKKPVIHEDDLLAGTTTSKRIGVVLYPDAHTGLLWGELKTLMDRPLNPYQITEEDIETLHFDILPYWNERTFRETVRRKYHEPVCQQLDERFAVYFQWKTVAISHTIPDFPKILEKGANKLIQELETELDADSGAIPGRRDLLAAMALSLKGMMAYAGSLSHKATLLADRESRPERRAELIHMAEMCRRVPAEPARTLDEALQCIWIVWVALHMENTNAGLSLGRLDQWLQPYFAADMQKCKTSDEKESYLRHAIEMTGCFFMKATDHLPMIPDVGNYLFGGSSSDQAITLGGVTPEGENGVNDMTYVLLKVTEMLKLRDPNVNARYHVEKNSRTYLKRLCEVNLITTATPSIHGDETVLEAIAQLGYPPEDARDWSATGCVEPTISGKHFGHTGCIMFNLVAGLEMALHQGRHPLMDWEVGPRTPAVEAMETFEAFFETYQAQLDFLMDRIVEYNNILGEAHAVIRPTPLLSSLIDGSVAKGRDVTGGGATYNSTGTACIGLSDVVDSLMVIRKLVFEEEKITFKDLKKALEDNFQGHPRTLAMIMNQVPKFGSGDPDAVAMANRVTRHVHDYFGAKRNYRGGVYTTGFWSMSNHVAFGTLTGALPSGRLAGKAFTPGLTPSAGATRNLLDNIRDVAALDPASMTNNLAFNVKFVPSAADPHEKAVDQMAGYAGAYFEMGGMQMQMNVVSGAVLRDAMLHPENYQDLLVRISGYNAYFVTLNRDMQIELIERAEYR